MASSMETTNYVENIHYLPRCIISTGRYPSFKHIDDNVITKYLSDYKQITPTEKNKQICKNKLWNILKDIFAAAKVKVIDEIIKYIKTDLKGQTRCGQLVTTYRQVPSWYMNKNTTDMQRSHIFYELFDVSTVLEMTRIIKNDLCIRYVQKEETYELNSSGNHSRTVKYGEVGKAITLCIKRLRDGVCPRKKYSFQCIYTSTNIPFLKLLQVDQILKRKIPAFKMIRKYKSRGKYITTDDRNNIFGSSNKLNGKFRTRKELVDENERLKKQLIMGEKIKIKLNYTCTKMYQQ